MRTQDGFDADRFGAERTVDPLLRSDGPPDRQQENAEAE
jgi:hypothetical protein